MEIGAKPRIPTNYEYAKLCELYAKDQHGDAKVSREGAILA